MSGGYREGSGRSKSGYYKGIYCGSTYELCWVIWALDKGIKFDRFQGSLTNGTLTYIPDFLLADGKSIIEIKGYEDKNSVSSKTKLAETFGYNVSVLRKENLQEIFEYVFGKFGTKKFYTLYDGYKPEYEYECAQCRITFTRHKPSKLPKVFCSRRCSVLGNKLHKSLSKQKILDRAKRFYENNKNEINKKRRERYKLKKTPRSSNGQEA